jgi:hypothetical protein
MEPMRTDRFKRTVARLATANVEQEEPSGSQDPAIDQLVSAIAFLVYNTWNSLWMSVTDLTDNVAKRFPCAEKALETADEIRFVVLNSSLVVNGAQIPARGRYLETLVAHLSGIDAKSFSITHGITQDEFMWLLDALSSSVKEVKAAGGFAALIEKDKLDHVLVRSVKVEVVADDEIIVDQNRANADGMQERIQAEEKMLAALSQMTCEYEEDYITGLQAVAKDPKRMAELILQAADARHLAEPATNAVPKLALLIDCLERSFQGLIKHSSFKTNKGKGQLKKTLKGLTKELQSRVDPDNGEDVRAQIDDTIDHMIEGLNTTTVASDYVKKLKALRASEKKVVDFMREQGHDRVRGGDLEDLLEDGGMDRMGWNSLLAKSGGGMGAGENGGTGAGSGYKNGEDGVEAIADMIARLEEQLASGGSGGDGEGIAQGITEVSHQVNALVDGTERKIQRLVELVGYDIDDVDDYQQKTRDEGLGPAISRRELVRLLADIVREIYQPLSMIKCSIETVKSHAVGQASPGQIEMLNVASQGISRIEMLIQCLGKISDITPD